jgi:prepilin-type N-terminal cleavage/methylation domain-containing protein
MNRPGGSFHPVAIARQAMRRRMAAGTAVELDEAGFTLIELIITVAILPIIVGGIAVALIGVLNLQGGTTNRISDSNDALVSSSVFNKDVQSAQEIQTVTTPACGSTGQQLVGLEWAQNANGTYETVVSYVASAVGTKTSLLRELCTSGASSTPTSSRVLGTNVGTPTVALTPTGFSYKTNQGWTPTQGLYGVTVNINTPGSGAFSYSLSGLPTASSSNGAAPQGGTSPTLPSCNLANEGSGQYAPILCFADFSASGASAATQAAYLKTFTNPSATCTPMQFSIADSPDILQFCLSVSGTAQTVAPQQIPTFDVPGQGDNSEPYLGNNGFYQGIQGYPAISSRPAPNLGNFGGCNGGNGCVTTLTFTNIQVTTATGAPATNWTLVTGDAESTDSNEFNLYTNSSVNWNILPNTPSSFYGDSCYDTADPNNNGLFKYTGPTPTTLNQYVGSPSNAPTSYDTPITINATTPYVQYPTSASSVGCESNVQLDKTGSLMLAAPEPSDSFAAQNVSITMQSGGYQAVFLGVLL